MSKKDTKKGKQMKHALNTVFHGTGYLCIMVGFIMMIAAAGNADLDGAMVDILHYGMCGVAASLVGLFLTRWRV